jgi:hypothetical protein
MSQFSFNPIQLQQLQQPPVTGPVLYVGSTVVGAANSVGRGYTPGTAFATLAYALTQVASVVAQGAAVGIPNVTIVVLAGHTESIAAASGITAVANVRVTGQGTGTNRPLFTFTTSTAATWVVAAANFSVENCRFTTTIDELVTGFSVSAAGFRFIGNEVVGTSSAQFISVITTTAAATRFEIIGNRFIQDTAPAANGKVINLVGGDDGVIDWNTFVWVSTSNAASNMIGGATTAALRLSIDYNTIYHTGGGAVVPISMHTGTTGMYTFNSVYSTQTTLANSIVLQSMASAQSFACNTVNTNGALIPVVDT